MEAAGYQWLAFLGAEDASLNTQGMFHTFQYNSDVGARFRWTKNEKVEYTFDFSSPITMGEKSISICLAAHPDLDAQPWDMRYVVRGTSGIIVSGSLSVQGPRKIYRIPFEIGREVSHIMLETYYAPHPAPSLQIKGEDVPEVGYLFFWIGLLVE